MDSTFQQAMSSSFQNLNSLNQVHRAFPNNIHETRDNAKPIIILFPLLSLHRIISIRVLIDKTRSRWIIIILMFTYYIIPYIV